MSYIKDIEFVFPDYYICSKELAKQRGVDPEKYSDGLGIDRISILKDQSLIDLAADSLYNLGLKNDLSEVDRIVVTTESSKDESVSMGEFILGSFKDRYGDSNLINNIEPPVELKHACVSSSVALRDLCWYSEKTNKPSILIVADEAKYDLESSGEPTQGCGAASILIDPKHGFLELNFDKTGYFNLPIRDFYRPFGKETPIVDGHLSNFVYLLTMRNAYDSLKRKHNLTIDDMDRIIFHTPYPKITEYASSALLLHEYRKRSGFRKVLEEIGDEPYHNGGGSLDAMCKDNKYVDEYNKYLKKLRGTILYKTFYEQKVLPSTVFARQVGNLYTGSLILALCSLLENDYVRSGDKIGFGAYGSGASSFVYMGELKEKVNLGVQDKLNKRKKLSISDYEYYRRK